MLFSIFHLSTTFISFRVVHGKQMFLFVQYLTDGEEGDLKWRSLHAIEIPGNRIVTKGFWKICVVRCTKVWDFLDSFSFKRIKITITAIVIFTRIWQETFSCQNLNHKWSTWVTYLSARQGYCSDGRSFYSCSLSTAPWASDHTPPSSPTYPCLISSCGVTFLRQTSIKKSLTV